MNVSEIFVRRPVMTTLVMVGVLVFGVAGYRQLPVASLPNVDFPTISVSASLPGASPETMASAVATPLEKQFSTIPSVDSMTSTSSLGSSSITLQFSLDRNIDAAAQDVQAAISAALRQLPPQMTTPPTFRKVNPADFPIFYIAFTSKTLRLSTLDEYAENTLAQRISTVRGVAQVNVYGSRKYAVRIDLDPDALSGRGLGIDTVAAAVASGNVNLPTGTLYGPNRIYNVNVERPADGCRRLRRHDRDVPERRAGAAQGHRQGLRRYPERQGRRDDQRRGGRRSRDPEAAGHERDPGGRGHQGDAARIREIAAGRRESPRDL